MQTDGGLREPAVLKLNFPRLDVRRPEPVERFPADLLPMMCCRAIVAYIAFVDALRSDAASVESIHSAANTPRVTLRSLAGRLARSRSLTAEAFARASLGVLP